MSRYNVLPAIANLLSNKGFSEGGYTTEKVGLVGLPELTIQTPKNRTNQKQPDGIQVVPFDFTNLKHVNSDGKAVYSSLGSLPQDTRYVAIDVKNIRIHDDNADWSKLTYDDQKGLMQNIIHCELEYFKTRFLNDVHFYKFLANGYKEIKYDERLYKLFFDHNVEVTVYSCIMWNALTRYQRNDELAFSNDYAIKAIRDSMPKDLPQSQMKKLVIKIAEDVDVGKFSLMDVPMLTPIQDFMSPLSFVADIEKATVGIFINASLPEAGKRPTNFTLKFGKKHVAMFGFNDKNHYHMNRINQQTYKLKSLKKELGL